MTGREGRRGGAKTAQQEGERKRLRLVRTHELASVLRALTTLRFVCGIVATGSLPSTD